MENDRTLSYTFTPTGGVEYKTADLTIKEYFTGVFSILTVMLHQLDEVLKKDKSLVKQKRHDMLKEVVLDALRESSTGKLKKKAYEQDTEQDTEQDKE